MYAKFWSETLKWKSHFEDLGMYGRMMLKRILRKEGEQWVHPIRERVQ
jgi:hypothetical protein